MKDSIKSLVERLTNVLDQVENRTSELEDKVASLKYSDGIKEKKKKERNYDLNLQELWDH